MGQARTQRKLRRSPSPCPHPRTLCLRTCLVIATVSALPAIVLQRSGAAGRGGEAAGRQGGKAGRVHGRSSACSMAVDLRRCMRSLTEPHVPPAWHAEWASAKADSAMHNCHAQGKMHMHSRSRSRHSHRGRSLRTCGSQGRAVREGQGRAIRGLPPAHGATLATLAARIAWREGHGALQQRCRLERPAPTCPPRPPP